MGRLETEAASLRAKVSHLEQASRAREKEMTRLREEAQGGMAIEREAAAAASERAAAAEEAARRFEGEAAGLRARQVQLEAGIKAAQKEALRLKVGMGVNIVCPFTCYSLSHSFGLNF